MSARTAPLLKAQLHPRNLHRAAYDFPALIASHPALREFVAVNPWGNASIDFANPTAVKALNAALLAHFYGVAHWDIPEGYLCPPIPGRADYIHNLADLLAETNHGEIPQGARIRMLDIGTGANAIYPILARTVYGWSCVGSEIDAAALRNAETIFRNNTALEGGFEGRLQEHREDILRDLMFADEHFDLSVCNPPFHASAEEAMAGTRRKLHNLGKADTSSPVLNFAGHQHELWCKGGELGFIRHMIRQSEPLGQHCLWFSTLVSKRENLGPIHAELQHAGAHSVRTLEMAQGQKISRAVAWTFLAPDARAAWAARHWR